MDEMAMTNRATKLLRLRSRARVESEGAVVGALVLIAVYLWHTLAAAVSLQFERLLTTLVASR